jgi:adenine-specific DNA-methyltransferase
MDGRIIPQGANMIRDQNTERRTVSSSIGAAKRPAPADDSAFSAATPTGMLRFFNAIRRGRNRILDEVESPLAFCEMLLGVRPQSSSATKLAPMLAPLVSDLRDYQIASVYALLIGKERRKELSAYFTPPALTAATLRAASPFLSGKEPPAILDPACGGGAFLVPLARAMIRAQLRLGTPADLACRGVLTQLHGIEIDKGLATLSRRLLSSMVRHEFTTALGREARGTIEHHDFLTAKFHQKFDLVVGNPPYGRVRSRVGPKTLEAAGLANNGGHTNFYSLFLMRALDCVKPGGGLVFVLPTSFVAGPYFSGLRQEILDRADVVRIDLHEQRENLFVGAVQDVCLLTLRRHTTAIGRTHHCYDVGLVDSNGLQKSIGSAETPTNGEPWMLPVAADRPIIIPSRLAPESARCFTLADYGYLIRVGKVVPTRERAYLYTSRCKDALPLLWASCVRPDGSFAFEGGMRSSNPRWYKAPTDQQNYTTRRPCVLVQRTSNRDQHRRLYAAPVSAEFLDQHKRRGFIAENHVIVLEAAGEKPLVSPMVLAALLNTSVVNERFSAISGTFSVSAKLLARLAFPDPTALPHTVTSKFAAKVGQAFARIDGILVPSDAARNAQHGFNKARDLRGSATINQNAGLKRESLART